jgi:hypothetical protein
MFPQSCFPSAEFIVKKEGGDAILKRSKRWPLPSSHKMPFLKKMWHRLPPSLLDENGTKTQPINSVNKNPAQPHGFTTSFLKQSTHFSKVFGISKI